MQWLRVISAVYVLLSVENINTDDAKTVGFRCPLSLYTNTLAPKGNILA
jgi:hypothetical protein